jgi:phenylacetate-CoA ligase
MLRPLLLQAALRVRGMDVWPLYRRCLAHDAMSSKELAAYHDGQVAQLLQQHIQSLAEIHRTTPEALGARLSPARKTHELLETLPPISKGQLSEFHARLASATRDSRSRLVEKRTSGSTGRPLRILKNADGLALELASTWRAYNWLGIEPGFRTAKIWGRPLHLQARLLAQCKDYVFNTVRLSAFDIDERALLNRLRQLRAARPRLIYGYTSAVTAFARFSAQAGLPIIEGLQAVVTTAEPLLERDRAAIEAGFHLPPRDEYGASEIGSMAHECEYGSRHVVADNVILEVLAPDGEVRPHGTGELLATDLANRVTPVIRYRLGDSATLAESECPCRRPYPVLTEIQGRVEQFIDTPDGLTHHPARACYLVDEALRLAGVNVESYQIIQMTGHEFILKVAGLDPAAERRLQQSALSCFRNKLHPGLDLQVERTSVIPKDSSGKYQLVRNLRRERLAAASAPGE